jgi:hypothetical protein
MRDLLESRAGQRHLYIARLKVYGVRHPVGGPRKRRGTALMKNVYSGDKETNGQFLTYHVWVSYAEPFVSAGVERGQWIKFSAVAAPYVRGYCESEREYDYTLTDAADIQILGEDYYGERSGTI